MDRPFSMIERDGTIALLSIKCRPGKSQARQPTGLRVRTDEAVFPMLYAMLHSSAIVEPGNLDRWGIEEFDIRLECDHAHTDAFC
jgi:hypothetical protein